MLILYRLPRDYSAALGQNPRHGHLGAPVPRIPKGPVRGSVVFLCIVINTLAIGLPLLVVAVLRLVVPLAAWRRATAPVLIRIAESWISVNTGLLAITQQIHWEVSGLEGLNRTAGTS